MKIIETHCHLDYLKAMPLAEILKISKEAGIEKIITIGVDPQNLDRVFEISNENENIYFTQGIHPHDAKECNDDVLKKVDARCSEKKMLAVGEIGLDYHYDNSPRQKQIEVFKSHLEIAIKNKKPVVIHSRDADEDMISVLSEYAPRLDKKGVIHSFTSGEELAKKALDLGFYLGFNGIITFKSAQNVRDIAKLCPLDKMLVETDSPFLTPVPNRGKENNPSNLPHIINKLAEIKNTTPEEISEATYINANKLFFEIV